MENIICYLCGGSPEINLYEINLSEEEKTYLGKGYSPIKVDICIGREIENLIRNGIKTYGCCCSHGDGLPECLVSINSKDKLNEMGYELHEYSKEHTESGMMEIYLKTDVQCELRKVLSGKVFRYLGK